MLAIGRCLMSEPRLIMFDEPSLGLSPVMVELVFEAIVTLKKVRPVDPADRAERGGVARDRGFRGGAGKRLNRLSGTAEHIKGDERIQSAYLGL